MLYVGFHTNVLRRRPLACCFAFVQQRTPHILINYCFVLFGLTFVTSCHPLQSMNIGKNKYKWRNDEQSLLTLRKSNLNTRKQVFRISYPSTKKEEEENKSFGMVWYDMVRLCVPHLETTCYRSCKRRTS